MDLRHGGGCEDWFFLAKAEWHLDNKDAARKWFEKADEWIEQHNAQSDELTRFRADAAELLGIAKSDTRLCLKTG